MGIEDEIPIEIVHELVGYKQQAANASFVGRFVWLEGTESSWFKRLFGGA